MFDLQIHSKNLEFIEFLRQNATYEAANDAFLFTTVEQASHTIARFMLVHIKNQQLEKVCHTYSFPTERQDELSLYLSSEQIEKLYHFISQKLLIFLSQSSLFDFEAFLQFRLGDEQSIFFKMLDIAYDEFMEIQAQENEEEPSTIEYLKKMHAKQPCQEEKMTIIVEKSGDIRLEGKETVYLEHEPEEDTILSYLILLGVKEVDVYELGGILSHEYMSILMQLFGEKVVFHGLENRTSSYPKKER